MPTPDVWGFCNVCDRWYYCERAEDQIPPCPVCDVAPTRVVDRAVEPREVHGSPV